MKGIFILITAGFFFSLFFVGSENHKYVNAGNRLIDSLAITPWYTDVLRDEHISASALYYAHEGFTRLKQSNYLSNDSLLTLIDFSKPSTEERFFILDMKNGTLVKKSLVAHGKNSGIIFADDFSNKQYSNKSSLGLFLTSDTYKGKHGHSLRIDGMDLELNSNARKRAIVIHGANYVNFKYIEENGRIGRSFGCPALPSDISAEVIDLIKEGSCLFIYHPSINITSQNQQGTIH